MSYIKQFLTFSIAYFNLEGIHDRLFQCKLEYIKNKFMHDIEIFSEVWGACPHNKEVEGYTLIEVKAQKHLGIKKGRMSGGFLIYIKKQFFSNVKAIKVTPYYVWLDIDKNLFHNANENLKLCTLYIPPDSSTYNNKDVFDELSLDIINFSSINHNTMLIGDLNARTGILPEFMENGEEDYLINKRNSPLRIRNNCDKIINRHGKKHIN